MIIIDNFHLFLNLSRKAQVVWKRFEKFQRVRKTHLGGELLGFYPSRDLYVDSDWSVYEVRHLPGEEKAYVALIWDYAAPMQRGTPTAAEEYFSMRPEYTAVSYKPIHYYKTEHQFIATLKKLHPKFSEYVTNEK